MSGLVLVFLFYENDRNLVVHENFSKIGKLVHTKYLKY